jgi:hypothetical protein
MQPSTLLDSCFDIIIGTQPEAKFKLLLRMELFYFIIVNAGAIFAANEFA